MDLIEAINTRRSIRKFYPDPVNETDLEEIIKAGTMAINAENKQMWYFVAVTNKDVIKKTGEAVLMRIECIANAMRTLGQGGDFGNNTFFLTFFMNAPAFIAVFTYPFISAIDKALESINATFKAPTPILPGQQSIGAAIQNISLAAHAKGYGTTCMNAPVLAYKEIGQLLEVAEPWVLSALIPIGRPAYKPKPRPHKPFNAVYRLIR